MRGKKCKAMRKIVGYSVTRDRPQLPDGGWLSMSAPVRNSDGTFAGQSVSRRIMGTCALPKGNPRRNYQFFKKRYGMVPMAHLYKRVSMARDMVDGLQPQT